MPGTISATWQLLQRRGSGRFGLPALWRRAIGYAENGWPVGPRTLAHYSDAPGEFLAPGRAQVDLAATLAGVAERGPDRFYRGPFAHALEAWSSEHGGFLRAADMAAHATYVGAPLGVRVGDTTFYAPPPLGRASAGGGLCRGRPAGVNHGLHLWGLLSSARRHVAIHRNAHPSTVHRGSRT